MYWHQCTGTGVWSGDWLRSVVLTVQSVEMLSARIGTPEKPSRFGVGRLRSRRVGHTELEGPPKIGHGPRIVLPVGQRPELRLEPGSGQFSRVRFSGLPGSGGRELISGHSV